MSLDDYGLYLVMTDPVTGYEKVTEAAVECGVRLVQLRMKREPQNKVLEMAVRLRSITKGSGTFFVVNDDLEVAQGSQADGLHVGQDDMSVAEARRLLPGKIIGHSTHNPDQVRAANEFSPDYIGVGPVFTTPTKENPDPTIHPDGMAEMIRLAKVPHVAIGGINAGNLRDVLRAGARNFAVVRAVCGASDPKAAILRLQEIWTGETA